MNKKPYIVTFAIEIESTSPEAAIEMAQDALHELLSEGVTLKGTAVEVEE